MTLILVPGHGVCRAGCTAPARAASDASWIGIHAGEAILHVAQIEAGVRGAAVDGAYLVFSGGATRQAAGERSEAASYAEIARDHGYWSHPEVGGRVLLEEYARDSLENLILGLCRLRREAGRWPERIRVVGWDFKAERFRRHAAAIGWPDARFEYLAAMSPPRRVAAETGERAKLTAVAADPLLRGEEWRRQRRARDPFGRGRQAGAGDGAVAQLLAFVDGVASAPPRWTLD